MKRRTFLKLFGTFPALLVAPQVIASPKTIPNRTVGYQGRSEYDAGYYYAPYTPLIVTENKNDI